MIYVMVTRDDIKKGTLARRHRRDRRRRHAPRQRAATQQPVLSFLRGPLRDLKLPKIVTDFVVGFDEFGEGETFEFYLEI